MKAALSVRERIVQVATAGATAPTNTTLPHITMSPKGANGMPCVGFSFVMVAPSSGAAIATAPGFTVTVYRLIPTLGEWAVMTPYTSYNFNDQLVSYEFGAGAGLYFAISNVATAGNVLLAVGELV